MLKASVTGMTLSPSTCRDLPLGRRWRRYEGADGTEDRLELGVAFSFEGGHHDTKSSTAIHGGVANLPVGLACLVERARIPPTAPRM